MTIFEQLEALREAPAFTETRVLMPREFFDDMREIDALNALLVAEYGNMHPRKLNRKQRRALR